MDEQALRNNLVELLRGGHAHVTVEDALNKLKPENRQVRPSSGVHSVWEELEHIRIAQEDILRYTLDPGWKSPKWPDGYWPSNSPIAEEAWNQAVSDLLSDLDEFVELVRNPKIDLTAALPHGEG